MIQLRPTFSESWYRVAGLKAKLRTSAQISRQYYRGDRWYVVRDPAGNQFHRLSDAAYRFVGLLDGTRTVQEAWDLVGGQLADDAPTQPEVIQILSQLHAANLLEADITADAGVLLRRHKMLQKRQMQGRLMNLLFPRIPIWDPDRFLKRWLPLAKLAFSKIGALVWCVVVLLGISVVASRWPEMKEAAQNAIAPRNWFYLWIVFALIKFIHELGHAFSCRRFGGECHEMGIMFLVFIPTPYVDASTAWAFPSKWQRMFVGLAGMVVELFVAALAAFVWASTSPGVPLWGIPVNELAYNTMLIASVTTVLFNANPLLRYDGYYILSDWLEIPNLRQRSTEYALGLIKRHVFRIKATQPLPPLRQRAWLLTYAITATIYRVFIGIVIILMVAYTVPVLGVLMAIGGIVTWLVVPVVKLTKYLAIDPELHRKRGRAIAFSAAVAAAVVIGVGVIPFWVEFVVEGVVEPLDKKDLFSGAPGFVSEIKAKDGEILKAGDVILVARNPELETEIEQLRHQLRALEIQRQQARADIENQHLADIYTRDIAAKEDQLAKSLDRLDKLTLRAPIDGQLNCPILEQLPGRYIPIGEQIGSIAPMDRLMVKATLEQRDAELVEDAEEKNPEIRVVGQVETVLHGYDIQVLHAASKELPHSAMGHGGGGQVAVDPSGEQGSTATIPQFEMRVPIVETGTGFVPGQRAYVQVKYTKKPLMWDWGRRFWQLIQSSAASSKWI